MLLPKFDECVFIHTKQITEKFVWEHLQHQVSKEESEKEIVCHGHGRDDAGGEEALMSESLV